MSELYPILRALKMGEGSGGGGGTSDYTQLSNKPQINSNELSGNKSSSDLGLQDALTETQLAAVNSGVTSSTVEQVANNTTNISLIQTALSIDNITSNITANTGYTIVTGMSAVYKQGKHIFGNIIVKKDENTYTANVEETIAVISNKPSAHVTTFCGFSTSEWNIKNIGYVFFSSSTGDIKVINSTAGNTTVNIHIDYCTA